MIIRKIETDSGFTVRTPVIEELDSTTAKRNGTRNTMMPSLFIQYYLNTTKIRDKISEDLELVSSQIPENIMIILTTLKIILS